MYLIFNLIIVVVCLITLEKQRKYYQSLVTENANLVKENAECNEINTEFFHRFCDLHKEIEGLENWKKKALRINQKCLDNCNKFKQESEKQLEKKQARIDELVATCKEYLVMIDDAQKEVAVLQARTSQVESELRIARGKMPYNTPWTIGGLN